MTLIKSSALELIPTCSSETLYRPFVSIQSLVKTYHVIRVKQKILANFQGVILGSEGALLFPDNTGVKTLTCLDSLRHVNRGSVSDCQRHDVVVSHAQQDGMPVI